MSSRPLQHSGCAGQYSSLYSWCCTFQCLPSTASFVVPSKKATHNTHCIKRNCSVSYRRPNAEHLLAFKVAMAVKAMCRYCVSDSGCGPNSRTRPLLIARGNVNFFILMFSFSHIFGIVLKRTATISQAKNKYSYGKQKRIYQHRVTMKINA